MVFRFFRRFAFRQPRTPRERALASLARGDFAAAETALTALIESAGDFDERRFLLNKRGVARVASGARTEAETDFAAALERGPYAPALANLGNLALERGELAAAIEHYEAAVAADEANATAHLNLAIAYKRCGRTAESVREFRRAQRLEGRRFRSPMSASS